jgi:hypothetical protein
MEARLRAITHGVAPVTDGWFVVNAADAQWIHHPDFGWQCPFEANGPVVRQREDIEPVRFPQVGLNISVLARGRRRRSAFQLRDRIVAVDRRNPRQLLPWRTS